MSPPHHPLARTARHPSYTVMHPSACYARFSQPLHAYHRPSSPISRFVLNAPAMRYPPRVMHRRCTIRPVSCTSDALTALCSRAGDALSAWCPLTGDALTALCSRTDDASTTLHQCAGDTCSCACPATSNRRGKQLRRMSGSPFELQGSSRRHQACSRSPPRAEPSRRHHRSRSPIQGRNSLPDRRGGRT